MTGLNCDELTFQYFGCKDKTCTKCGDVLSGPFLVKVKNTPKWGWHWFGFWKVKRVWGCEDNWEHDWSTALCFTCIHSKLLELVNG